MNYEYLLFNLAVIFVPALTTAFLWKEQKTVMKRLLFSTLVVAIPYWVWDSLVTHRHWWFNEKFTSGLVLFSLPLGEWLFFITVPYASIFLWLGFRGFRFSHLPQLRRLWLVFTFVFGALALFAAAEGWEYTCLAASAMAVFSVADGVFGTALWARPSFWLFAGLTFLLTGIFNHYLVTRPVVLYDEAFKSGLFVNQIPLEDYFYGLSLIGFSLLLLTLLEGEGKEPSLFAWLIRKRLGGYEHSVETPDLTLPLSSDQAKHVAVIGAGLAGITAAERLARRGLRVTLIEKNPYIGGKIAAWTEDLGDGEQSTVEHGFHAYFGHYYNLNRWLKELDLTKNLTPISTYRVLTLDGNSLDFRTDIKMAPGLNLIELARAGLYNLGSVVFSATSQHLAEFLKYNPKTTFKEWDHDHFEGYATRAALPRNLLLVFRTFARSFFAEDDRISLAELIKSFHFFYLSHNHGLSYDYVDGSYEKKLIGPLREHLRAQGIDLKLGQPVQKIDKSASGYAVHTAEESIECDALVMAADIRATKAIWENSASLKAELPHLDQALDSMRAGQRYAVMRVWLEANADADQPVFIATERREILDSITFLHRVDPDLAQWVKESPDGSRSVLELHSYAVPDSWQSEEQLKAAFLSELKHFIPSLKDAQVNKLHLQWRDDFTALHTGLHAARPKVVTETPEVVLAGDWVKLDFPAMLMEAAHTSGLLAANRLLQHYGLQGYQVTSVPPRGLLAPRDQ